MIIVRGLPKSMPQPLMPKTEAKWFYEELKNF